MNTQASKTLIGAFVVGAIFLIVAGVLVFGGGQFMKKTNKYVLFFKGSVKGLNVGAAVLFRGVKIGTVKNITLEADAQDLEIYIPVIVEIDPERIHVIRGKRDAETNIRDLLKKGLRAQLTANSLVTGQLVIELEFHPDTPLNLIGLNRKYPEIPTIPSTLDLIFGKLKELNVDKMVKELSSAISTLQKVLSSPEIPEMLHSFRMTADEAHKLVKKLEDKIDVMAEGFDQTVKGYGKLARDLDKKIAPLAASVDSTLKDARKLVRNADQRVNTLVPTVELTLKDARAALKRAEKALAAAEKTVDSKSPVIYQLDTTMKEIARMARSIRSLADYLERHPDALLFGKGKSKRR